MPFIINHSGKYAVVTGASSGIGRGIAQAMAAAGAHVIGCGLRAKETDEVEELLQWSKQNHCTINYIQADVSIAEEREKFISEVANICGGSLHYFISNAGKNMFAGAEQTTPEFLQQNAALNFESHWHLSLLCKPLLQQSREGVIILMASNHAFATLPGCFPYNSTKAAVVALVQSLAIEWGPDIRTVGLAPGFIDTPGNQQWFNGFEDAAQKRKETEETHPVKRIGTPEEIGNWCVFLCSAHAGFASGTTFVIDGGRSALLQ